MKKIFIGMNDIASQVSDFRKTFKALGYETFSLIEDGKSVIQNKKVDKIFSAPYFIKFIRPYTLQNKFREWYWNNNKTINKYIDNYDIFIFFWRSIRPDSKDLEMLKKKGKKIVFFCVGSDVRWIESYEQEMKNYSIPSCFSNLSKKERKHEFNLFEKKITYLRNIEKYADLIFNLPNQSQLSLRPYFHFFVPIDLSQIKENTEQRVIPRVAHAPSRRSIKGTEIILEVFKKLKSEGIEFEEILIENMPYEKALTEYTNSDILIGELYIPSAGKLDREALAAGCVVLSSMRYDYIDNTPNDCPIIDVNPSTIYTELKNIILDHPRRIALSKMGRPYVEKYHDVRKICSTIIKRLDEKPNEYDHYPVFFTNQLVISGNREQNIVAKTTKLVNRCSWYTNFVKN